MSCVFVIKKCKKLLYNDGVLSYFFKNMFCLFFENFVHIQKYFLKTQFSSHSFNWCIFSLIFSKMYCYFMITTKLFMSVTTLRLLYFKENSQSNSVPLYLIDNVSQIKISCYAFSTCDMNEKKVGKWINKQNRFS